MQKSNEKEMRFFKIYSSSPSLLLIYPKNKKKHGAYATPGCVALHE
jgi:hypothetical protein